jgi:hypothetical protein
MKPCKTYVLVLKYLNNYQHIEVRKRLCTWPVYMIVWLGQEGWEQLEDPSSGAKNVPSYGSHFCMKHYALQIKMGPFNC